MVGSLAGSAAGRGLERCGLAEIMPFYRLKFLRAWVSVVGSVAESVAWSGERGSERGWERVGSDGRAAVLQLVPERGAPWGVRWKSLRRATGLHRPACSQLQPRWRAEREKRFGGRRLGAHPQRVQIARGSASARARLGPL